MLRFLIIIENKTKWDILEKFGTYMEKLTKSVWESSNRLDKKEGNYTEKMKHHSKPRPTPKGKKAQEEVSEKKILHSFIFI